LRDLVYSQAKINESILKKLAANDKSLETIHAKMDGFSTSIKNQLSFYKMLETQLAQLAAATPPAVENVNAVTTRGGKSTRDPPHPNLDNRKKASTMVEELSQDDDDDEKVHEGKTALHEFYDTQVLSFPMKAKKPTTDEQFNRFVEMIQKVNINVPLMDAMQVPTYAHCLKDIINNKRPLPSTEVVKLTEACSAAILHQLPEKKKDPGCPTIKCLIGIQIFDKALCDLGASVSVMPKAIFDQLNNSMLTPTLMQLQLADSLVRHLEEIPEDVPVRVRDCFVPVDFMVLNMGDQKETTLILERHSSIQQMHTLMLGPEKSDSVSMEKRNLIFGQRKNNA